MPRVRPMRHIPLAALVLLSAGPLGAAPVELPGGAKLERVDFERHVMGLFGKTGCNNGSCHGSFQGKNGFRLSLFGYDPDKDFAALTREAVGRRINPVDPDQSLLLLKAVGHTRHEGGVRFGRDSWAYRVFREWVAQGADWTKGSGTVEELTVTPGEYAFGKAGEAGRVVVTARFADGSAEEVTPFCDFRVQDDAVAEASPLGEVRSLKPGDTALVVSYRGTVRAVRLLVPAPLPAGAVHPPVPEHNFIDREVFAKLRRLNMAPSELAGDAGFLRRVTIDTTGTLPAPEEVRAFLADRSPDKRARKIDELLARPLHAAVWATKFSDITGNNTDALENPPGLKARRSQMWHDWLVKRFRDNQPYDQLVKDVLCATSLDGQPPERWLDQTRKFDGELDKGFVTSYADRKTLDLFWRRQQNVPVEQWGEKVAAAFLGVRLECAQCHKHPTDRWTQVDYRSFANLFGQVTFGNANAYSSPEVKALADAENAKRKKAYTGKGNANQVNQVREMFITPALRSSLPHPETNANLPPRLLGGPEVAIEDAAPAARRDGPDRKRQPAPRQGGTARVDARERLWEWMVKPDNPFFARSFANRVWAHYFGVGIVDPVDDFSLANPPSNPALLDALAAEFVRSGFDVRHLERLVLNSRAYQSSSVPNATNKLDRKNYARAYARPLMAEVVVDVLNSALGVAENFGNDGPAGRHMTEIGTSRVTNQSLSYALRIFGRPPRTTACDCERTAEPALPQTLFRMTDRTVLDKLKAKGGRLDRLLRDKAKPDAEVFEDLFLATLSRLPNPSERAAFEEVRAAEADREKLFTDTLWALINTREFILNH